MANLEFEGSDNMDIRVVAADGSMIAESHTVEAHLLYAILGKLEEIRCGIIDVECAVERN